MPRPFATIAITLLTFTVSATAVRADKCTGAKLKAIGQQAAGLLGCQSTVATKGDASGLFACETKIAAKFSTAFAKAGMCPGVESTCAARANDCETALASAMTDALPSKCEAAKRKAAGKLASAELGCYAKAAGRGAAVDANCIAKAVANFDKTVAKAGSCPDGGSPRTLVEIRCVAPSVATDGTGTVTDVCAITTSTTSTTATITTTTTTSTTTLPQLIAAPTCLCVWTEPGGVPCGIGTDHPTPSCGQTCDQITCPVCTRPGECSGAATVLQQSSCDDTPCP